jgi:uncharacterized membrane protein YkoI
MRLTRLLSVALVAACLSIAGIAASGPAQAAHLRARDRVHTRDHAYARRGVSRGELVPLGAVIGNIRAHFHGRLLDASIHELVPGQQVYRVLILTDDGRRIAIWADARTGQILRVEG